MFKTISVDGLRSLTDFKMELNPGLNVLVGPNGSGKTNILIAFELLLQLHNLNRLNEQNTIVNIDIAKLFDIRKKDKKICIQIVGVVNSFSHEQLTSMIDTKAPIDMHYKFECEIALQPTQQNKLYFSRQSMEIESELSESGERTSLLSFEYSNENLTINQLEPKYLHKDIPTSDIESYFKYESKSLKFCSVIHEFERELLPFPRIKDEFTFPAPYDFQPEIIRYGIEVSNINNNSKGGRLLPTLLEVFNGRNNSRHQNSNIRNLNYDDIYDKIIGYLKLTCPEVVNLEVSYNSLRNIIESYAIFEGANGKSDKIPLELMSDGTLKWLSLTSALLTSRKMFLIEEPENFIHPSMQQDFVDLMRATIKHRQIIGIFTTHSESILNSLDPAELIVTNFQSGRTIVNHVKNVVNIGKIKEKLQSTGFGLGWYYLSGSLDPDPAT